MRPPASRGALSARRNLARPLLLVFAVAGLVAPLPPVAAQFSTPVDGIHLGSPCSASEQEEVRVPSPVTEDVAEAVRPWMGIQGHDVLVLVPGVPKCDPGSVVNASEVAEEVESAEDLVWAGVDAVSSAVWSALAPVEGFAGLLIDAVLSPVFGCDPSPCVGEEPCVGGSACETPVECVSDGSCGSGVGGGECDMECRLSGVIGGVACVDDSAACPLDEGVCVVSYACEGGGDPCEDDVDCGVGDAPCVGEEEGCWEPPCFTGENCLLDGVDAPCADPEEYCPAGAVEELLSGLTIPEVACVNADCAPLEEVCAEAACDACVATPTYCDADAEAIAPLLAASRDLADDVSRLHPPDALAVTYPLLGSVMRGVTGATTGVHEPLAPVWYTGGWVTYSVLVPCEGSGFRPLGLGDACLVQELGSAQPYQDSSVENSRSASSSSASVVPSAKAPENPRKRPDECASGQYHFRALARASNGADVEVYANCHDFRADSLAGDLHRNRWRGVIGGAESSVSLQYDKERNRAELVVRNGVQDEETRVVAFEVRVAGSMLRYEASHMVPSKVTMGIGDITAGFTGEAELGPRLVVAYVSEHEGGDVNDWVLLRVTPQESSPGTSYALRAGSFQAPDGSVVGVTAPTDFTVDVLFQEGRPGKGSLSVAWSSTIALTPAQVTWTVEGVDSTLVADSLPKTASVIVDFRNDPGDAWARVRLNVGDFTVSRVWLPVGAPATMLVRVPSLNVEIVSLNVSPFDPLGCDEWLTTLFAASKDPRGEAQVCVVAWLSKAGGEVWLDGGKVRVHALPAGELRATVGPAGSVHFEEVRNTEGVTGLHAALTAADSERLGSVEFLRADEIVNLTFIPGATLASGASKETSECGSSGKKDAGTGRGELFLEAYFASTRSGGSVAASMNQGGDGPTRLEAGRVLRFSTVGDVVDVGFMTGGGFLTLDASMGNGCDPTKTIDFTASGVTSLRVWGGDQSSADSAALMVTRITGTPYAAISVEATAWNDWCEDVTISGWLSTRDARVWHVDNDVDSSAWICNSWKRWLTLSGDEEWSDKLWNRYVVTYRFARP